MSFPLFQILDLSPEQALSISDSDLEKRFYQLSMKWHPDRNLAEVDRATERSSQLNEAYQTIKDPWKRAAYLLDVLGLERSKNLPTDLAEIYFGLQEEGASREELLGFLKILEKMREERERALKEFFQSYRGPFIKTASSFLKLKDWVAEDSYARSMERDLRAKLTALSCGEIKSHDS